MPDAHAVRATAAAAAVAAAAAPHPQAGTSRETTEVGKKSLIRLLVHPVMIGFGCALLRCGPVTSDVSRGAALTRVRVQGGKKFSPRSTQPGPGGEGLCGRCATRPSTRGGQDDSEGQRCVLSLQKETNFLRVVTLSEPQPRVRCARPFGERAAGSFQENKLGESKV